jgi:hypothetical protein
MFENCCMQTHNSMAMVQYIYVGRKQIFMKSILAQHNFFNRKLSMLASFHKVCISEYQF